LKVDRPVTVFQCNANIRGKRRIQEGTEKKRGHSDADLIGQKSLLMKVYASGGFTESQLRRRCALIGNLKCPEISKVCPRRTDVCEILDRWRRYHAEPIQEVERHDLYLELRRECRNLDECCFTRGNRLSGLLALRVVRSPKDVTGFL
jgi:hypothetical protein